MGIVRRESIKSSIYTYVGVGIGFINTTFIITNLLTPQIVGLLTLFRSFSGIFSQLSLFSLDTVTLKFFPFFRNKEKNHNGFLFFSIMVAIIGFLLAFLITLIFKQSIIGLFVKNSSLFVNYFYYVFPIAFAFVFNAVYTSYLQSLLRITFVTAVREVYIRIFVIVAIVFYYLGYINIDQFVITIATTYLLSTLLLTFYIIKIKEFKINPNFKILTKNLLNKIRTYAFFNYLNGIAGRSILEIDKLMIASISIDGMSNTGVYGVASMIGMVIGMPQLTISAISIPLLSEAFKKKIYDRAKVYELYVKTSLNQLIVGSFIFMLIWFNTDSLLSFMQKDYSEGKYVILIIAIMRLFDMATGINGGIILFSKYYRVNLYMNIGLLILTVTTNLLLIKPFGIIGAAVATATSLILFNIMKMIFVWIKFRLIPFTFSTVKALLIFGITYLIVYFIPPFANTIIDIIVRSLIILSVFSFLILSWKVSEDVNDLYLKVLERVKNYLRK